MQQYFIRQFNYDRHVNQLMLDAIAASANPGDSVKLMAHLLATQQVWLMRCKQKAYTGAIWPDTLFADMSAILEENHAAWLNYLENLPDDGFDQIVDYKNSRGIPYSGKISDILAHVINHGTHHRAQSGQYLKTADTPLPVTDYIYYIWQQQ